MFRVYFTGEYDLDIDGNVFVVYRDYSNYDIACYDANKHAEKIGYIATIELL